MSEYRFCVNTARADGWGDKAEAFVTWQRAMDRIVQARIHISIHDLPDWDFADAFTSGMSAKDAAEAFISEVLEEHGFDPDDF